MTDRRFQGTRISSCIRCPSWASPDQLPDLTQLLQALVRNDISVGSSS